MLNTIAYCFFVSREQYLRTQQNDIPILPSNQPASIGASRFFGNWLYANTADGFIQHATDKEVIAAIVEQSYWYMMEKKAELSELQSWKYSLHALSQLLRDAGLHDQLVILEYMIPSRDKYPNRIDAVVCGLDINNKWNAVLFEFKQWDACNIRKSLFSRKLTMEFKNIRTPQKHPAIQARMYKNKMRKLLKILKIPKDSITFHSCAYLHNSHPSVEQRSVLFHKSYRKILADTPLYTKQERNFLIQKLQAYVPRGDSQKAFEVFHAVHLKSAEKASKLPIRKTKSRRFK